MKVDEMDFFSATSKSELSDETMILCVLVGVLIVVIMTLAFKDRLKR